MQVIFLYVSVMEVVILKNFKSLKMTEIDRDNDRYKNDRDMTGVLCIGVQEILSWKEHLYNYCSMLTVNTLYLV